MGKRRGAEIIVDHLVDAGIEYVFGLCGHGNLGLLDALYDRSDEIKTVSVHHESVAGFMADAWFRVRGTPVATFTSCGPGSANLPVALGSALMDSSAFLAITGNVPTAQFNRAPFQETGRFFQADFPSVVRPYVKRSYQATRVEQLPGMLAQALRTMTQGRPGPVHLDVPLDVFVEEMEIPDGAPPEPGARVSSRVGAAGADLEAAIGLVVGAERPVIVVGQGAAAGEGPEVIWRLAESLGVPVATSPLGKGLVDSRNPLSLGATGRNGTYQANRATRNADVVLALGTRFDDRSTSSWIPGYTYSIPPSALVHVHIDPAELGRNYPPTVGIVGDPSTVAGQLLGELERKRSSEGGVAFSPEEPGRRAWRESVGAWASMWESHVRGGRTSEAVPIHPQRALAEVRKALPEETVLITDVGVHHNWIVQDWRSYSSGLLLQSWGFASMGFGVAGCLGAKLAAPERPVLAVVGDGGFMMLPSAVATAVQYQIPVVWLIWNNGGFVSIRDQQVGYFGRGREIATMFERHGSGEAYGADFAMMARSMGAEGIRVEQPGHLGAALREALAGARPTVIDVGVDGDCKPASTATWDLPPLPHPEPSFGWPDG